jgi:hypothetical protein
MSSADISLPKDVDVSKITYAAPKMLDNGGKMIYMYHKGKPFIMQIPILESPYGVTKWSNDKGYDKINVDLSFGKDDNNADVVEFRKIIEAIDNKLIDDGLTNAQTWFKKKLATREVVEALYSPLVKHSKDKDSGEITNKYPPTVRFQIPQKVGKIACEIYDASCKKVELESIETKRAKVTAIVQCNGVWIAGGKFGCTFKVLQMKVLPSTSAFKGYAFIEDEDDFCQ